MIKLIPIFLIAALSASLVAGCGGSDATAGSSNADSTNPSAETEGPLTQAEFIKQGDALCEKADKETYNRARRYRVAYAKELEKLGPVPAEEKLIRLIVLPNVVKEVEGLEALGAPKGDEKQIESFLAGIEGAVKKAQKNPYAIEGEPGYGPNPFQGIDVRLREYGFNVCRIIT
jgi:hypothetical protein